MRSVVVTASPVHPRVRGDDGDGRMKAHTYNGSPPRARGRRQVRLQQDHVVRFTPACAGTTPRAATARHGRRFTPACAGTTRRPGPPMTAAAVHPRVRGDDLGFGFGDASLVGSPPRARGRHLRVPCIDLALRFTPACAGTTPPGGSRETHAPVHPRVRGDDRGMQPARNASSGSPPRARGRRLPRRPGGPRGRFTPACAGTTRCWRSARPCRTVHPRVRGDDLVTVSAKVPLIGSPPRARGRRRSLPYRQERHRFTPACAGTTRRPTCKCRRSTVHPRVRGDDGGCVW